MGNVCRLAAGGWGGWTFERRFSHLGARTNLVVGPWIEEAENDEDALRDMLEGEGRGGGVPVVGPGTRGGGGDGDGRGGSAAAIAAKTTHVTAGSSDRSFSFCFISRVALYP